MPNVQLQGQQFEGASDDLPEFSLPAEFQKQAAKLLPRPSVRAPQQSLPLDLDIHYLEHTPCPPDIHSPRHGSRSPGRTAERLS